MKTHAKRRGGDWVINGAKMWITNSPIADMSSSGRRPRKASAASWSRRAPGLAAQEIQKKISLRASVTGAMFFDNVRVPERHMLPGNVCGLKGPLGA